MGHLDGKSSPNGKALQSGWLNPIGSVAIQSTHVMYLAPMTIVSLRKPIKVDLDLEWYTFHRLIFE